MSRKTLIVFGMAAFAVLAGGAWWFFIWKNDRDNQPYKQTTLRLNWIFTGSFGGEVVGSKRFAKSNGIDLKLEQGGQGLDPLKLVAENEFGIAAADEILRANSKGADFIIIGVVNDDSPTAYVALKKSGIKAPGDFVGKRVGILPFGSTGLVYQSLMKKTGVDRKTVKEIVVSPDLRSFIAASTHDVQPIFIYDETVSLDRQKVDYDLIEPTKYGVVFKGPCYFTQRSTVRNNPELVTAFARTMIQGWNEAITNPPQAITLLKELDSTIDYDRELAVLQKGLPYFGSAKRRPLESDPTAWAPMLDDLVAFGVLSARPDPDQFLDLSFVNKCYKDKH